MSAFYLRHFQAMLCVERNKEEGGEKQEKKKKENDVLDHTKHRQYQLTALPTPYTESL